MIRLQPVAMLVPNSAFIYQPSRLRPVKEVSEREFLEYYADQAHVIRFVPDSVSEVVEVTAYGHGLHFWYIVL